MHIYIPHMHTLFMCHWTPWLIQVLYPFICVVPPTSYIKSDMLQRLAWVIS